MKITKQNNIYELSMISDIYSLLVIVWFYMLVAGSMLFCTCLAFLQSKEDGLFMLRVLVAIFGLLIYIHIKIRKTYPAIIRINKNGISYRIIGHKKRISKNYEDLPFISIAWYPKNGLGDIKALRKYFIVISAEPLPEFYKTLINCKSMSENLIKIEYSKANYEKLCSVLPESHKNQLIQSVTDVIQ